MEPDRQMFDLIVIAFSAERSGESTVTDEHLSSAMLTNVMARAFAYLEEER